jgi:hypothetical protein
MPTARSRRPACAGARASRSEPKQSTATGGQRGRGPGAAKRGGPFSMKGPPEPPAFRHSAVGKPAQNALACISHGHIDLLVGCSGTACPERSRRVLAALAKLPSSMPFAHAITEQTVSCVGRETHGRRGDPARRRCKLVDTPCEKCALENRSGRAAVHFVRLVAVALPAELRRLVGIGVGVVRVVGAAQEEHGRVVAARQTRS